MKARDNLTHVHLPSAVTHPQSPTNSEETAFMESLHQPSKPSAKPPQPRTYPNAVPAKNTPPNPAAMLPPQRVGPDHQRYRASIRRRGPQRSRPLGGRPDQGRPQPLRGGHPRRTGQPLHPHRSPVGRRHRPGTLACLIGLLDQVSAGLRRPLTWDQGREMADWQQLRDGLDLPVYFCAPPTRTPTGCCAAGSPNAPTCATTASTTTPSPTTSTPCPAGPTTGAHPPPSTMTPRATAARACRRSEQPDCYTNRKC